MKNRKRILCFLLSIIMTLGLFSGCQTEPTPTETAESTNTEQTAPPVQMSHIFKEAVELGEKMLCVIEAYKLFENLNEHILFGEKLIRKLMTRGYAQIGEFEKAAEQLLTIAEKCADKEEALALTAESVAMADEANRDKIRACKTYSKTMEFIDGME